uniref:Wsv035-like protein n=1 Tax=Trachysalambria curvirostris nimavirus TaxID=2984282 RepID=A0A9C7F8B7_9VIRU|nr:MAG: wsv035-like protein [Trachysalambria curvirostris nimavirus]
MEVALEHLYLPGQGSERVSYVTPIVAISVVLLLAFAIATLCAAVAFRAATPFSVNASALRELELKSKLRVVEGSNPEKIVKDYLAVKRNLVGVDNLSTFPPHPAIDDLMGVTNKGNPWNVPSEVRERGIRETADASELTSLHVPQHQRGRMHAATQEVVDQYLGAIRGTKLKERMFRLRRQVASSVEDKELFDSIFGEAEIYHHAPAGSDIANTSLQSDNDILAHRVSGYCDEPVPAIEGKTCAEICHSSSAVRVKAPFIAGGVFIPRDDTAREKKDHCWARKRPINNAYPGSSDRNTDELVGGSMAQYCSPYTATLVLTNDAGWQCRPKFPTFFGGRFGTTPAACQFNSATHMGPEDVFKSSGVYIDLRSGRAINSHSEFPKSTYLRLLRSSKSIKSFKERARDPDLLFDNPIVCNCSGRKDVLNNPLVNEQDARLIKFRGMYECLENPCNMVPSVADDFSVFDTATGTCTPGRLAPPTTVNAILGDNRTPLVGQVPAMGLILADMSKRADGIHTKRGRHPYTEKTAKEITLAAAPVVTAVNLDSSNATRNVLFVPLPSMVLPLASSLAHVNMRPSSLLHIDCLPPILNRYDNQYRPFCTAAFYVEPAANILAGHVPQKPYEHNMLVTECLRNSRMISGSISGGAEVLYSTLLSHDSLFYSWSRDMSHRMTAGDRRLEEIRDFFDRNFNNSRRLSNSEYLARRDNIEQERIFDGISPWDSLYRPGDFDKCGIKNQRESFVLKEGLLIRSYGPYAATVLASNSFDFSFIKGVPGSKTPSALKPYNPLQFAFPTSHSILPEEGSPGDIFSVDKRRIFDSTVISDYFDSSAVANTVEGAMNDRLFSENDSSPLSHYRVDPDSNAWGLQTFRLDYNPRKGPAIVSDPRLKFDTAKINANPPGATLTPLSLFKKSPLEWGHAEADMQRSRWFREGIDTSSAHRRLLAETSMAIRNTWFSLTWENENYYFVENSG